MGQLYTLSKVTGEMRTGGRIGSEVVLGLRMEGLGEKGLELMLGLK